MAAIKTTDEERIRAAKRVFVISLFDLSWRLFGAVLLPVFIGMYIDSQRGDSQTFTMFGLGVGIICAGAVIYSVARKLMKRGQNL